jgi:predicted dehydrogenase
MAKESSEEYGKAVQHTAQEIPAPKLPYLPPKPKKYNPPIGLIGCGGISEYHLAAYQEMGLNVVALCDVDETRAQQRQATFFPDAEVYAKYEEVIARDDIEVIDAATHPEVRIGIIEAALDARKHVLSQKPFVTDLEVGKRFVALAEKQGVQLAVNQNGRWAPHFSWMRQAVAAGITGPIQNLNVSMQWDHSWMAGTPFDEIHHLILYDFAIHWFDICTALMGDQQHENITASVRSCGKQKPKPPMLAQVMIDYPQAQASLSFNGACSFGQCDTTTLCGEKATIRSTGPSLTEQSLTLYTETGFARPVLEGDWFTNGFQGAIGELLCAIEDGREPNNNARDNLRSLKLCFDAIKSADKE